MIAHNQGATLHLAAKYASLFQLRANGGMPATATQLVDAFELLPSMQSMVQLCGTCW